jgi:hypothetical protein
MAAIGVPTDTWAVPGNRPDVARPDALPAKDER